MERHDRLPMAPGASILGGAAGGLSYEGTLRDAMAREDRERRREIGRSRPVPPAVSQVTRIEADLPNQSRIAGG
jgi:hypothetical protein